MHLTWNNTKILSCDADCGVLYPNVIAHMEVDNWRVIEDFPSLKERQQTYHHYFSKSKKGQRVNFTAINFNSLLHWIGHKQSLLATTYYKSSSILVLRVFVALGTNTIGEIGGRHLHEQKKYTSNNQKYGVRMHPTGAQKKEWRMGASNWRKTTNFL